MKTLYKYVDFNEEFQYQGVTYIKANHNRGRLQGARPTFRKFSKSDIVEANIVDNQFTEYMKVV